MSSHRVLRDVIAQYYDPIRNPREEGVVAWVSAFAPVEILRAMGVACFYPESYAATCSARGLGKAMIGASSQRGLSRDVCSYVRVFYGSTWDDLGPLGKLPSPDILVATNNQCGTVPAWWEGLMHHYGVPLFQVDYPRGPEGPTRATLEYVRQQHEQLSEGVAELVGQKLDHHALERTLGLSREAGTFWAKIQELRKHPRFDGETRTIIDALFSIVVMRGTEICVDYYRELHSEMARKVNGEMRRPRLLWHGYPCWFLPARVILPGESQAKIVMDTYSQWWVLDLSPGDAEDALAQAYCFTYLNRPAAVKMRELEAMVSEYRIDAVLVHSNRSCKRAAAAEDLALRRLEELGIPACRFEGDMADPVAHSGKMAEAHARVLLEILEN